MMIQFRALEEVLKDSQDAFTENEVSSELKAEVQTNNVYKRGRSAITIGGAVSDYLLFQNDLAGFWNILRLCEGHHNDLASFLEQFRPPPLPPSPTDLKEEERGDPDGSADEQPPPKKKLSPEQLLLPDCPI
jgi:hypothetical protein